MYSAAAMAIAQATHALMPAILIRLSDEFPPLTPKMVQATLTCEQEDVSCPVTHEESLSHLLTRPSSAPSTNARSQGDRWLHGSVRRGGERDQRRRSRVVFVLV